MSSVKSTVLGFAAMAASIAAPLSAARAQTPPPPPAPLAECMAKPAMALLRDEGCTASLRARKMQDWEMSTMMSCFGMAPAARAADSACAAIWRKYPQIVRMRPAA